MHSSAGIDPISGCKAGSLLAGTASTAVGKVDTDKAFTDSLERQVHLAIWIYHKPNLTTSSIRRADASRFA